MKKALAILMAIAMVSMTFAQGMPAPKLTYGFSGSVETQLLKEKTVAQNVAGGTNYASNTSEMRPTALTPTRMKYETFANMDWSKMTIDAKVKYDSHKANFKDFSTFTLTTTWKDFFGFKVVHTYKTDNKEQVALKTPPATKDISAKTAESKLSFTLDKLKSDGFKFYVDYDAVRFLSLVNVAQSGNAVSNLLAGFYKMGFQIDNDEVAAKIDVKNTYNGGTTAAGLTSSTDDMKTTVSALKVDALQIEAKKMFGVWSAIFNSKDAMSYRLKNLGSDVKIDQLKYELGKDNTILEGSIGKGAMNINNTITPIKGVTIKVGVVAPSFYTQSVQDWLRGGDTSVAFTATGDLIDAEDTDDVKNAKYDASNLAFALQYSTETLGTISAGMRVNQDYTIVEQVGTTVVEGTTRALMARPTASTNILWGNAAWVEADLSTMLGKDKGLFVWVDGQSGEFLHNYDNLVANLPADAKYKLKTGTATKMNIGAEFKMKASDALTVQLGAQGSLGFGYDYKKANANVSYKEALVDPAKNINTNLVDASYNEANYLAKSVYGITPLTVKARVDFKLNPTVTLYVKDEFKSNEKNYAGETFSAAGKAWYGYNDKNTLTLGAKLTATKKSTLTAEGAYSAWTNVPAFSKLAPVNGYTNDNAKKAAKSNYDAKISSTFTPWSIKATYAYKY